MAEYSIREDDLSGAPVAALLQLHLDDMYKWTPPESVHAMPIERLRAPDVTFYTAWDESRLAACGALKQLAPDHGEIKSMRADPQYRGKGAGRAILLHLLAEGRTRGYTRLSLETGAPEDFLPARRLYASHGFSECGPLTGYVDDPFSLFMTRTL